MKSQSNNPKRTSKKSLQVNSQELDKILLTSVVEDAFYRAKTELIELALSCLEEKHVCDEGCKYHSKAWTDEHIAGVHSWNAAIDTIEQKIKERFS